MTAFSTPAGTTDRAREHATVFAEALQRAGFRSANVWSRPGVGTRVYFQGGEYVSVGQDGSISTSVRGRATAMVPSWHAKWRQMYSTARAAHLAWHQAALQDENTKFGGVEDDFDLLPQEAEPEASRDQKAQQTFSAMGRDALFYVGTRRTKVFRVIKDEGVEKWAVLHGTAERKLYRVRPVSLVPFLVGAFERLGDGSEALVSHVSPGAATKV